MGVNTCGLTWSSGNFVSSSMIWNSSPSANSVTATIWSAVSKVSSLHANQQQIHSVFRDVQNTGSEYIQAPVMFKESCTQHTWPGNLDVTIWVKGFAYGVFILVFSLCAMCTFTTNSLNYILTLATAQLTCGWYSDGAGCAWCQSPAVKSSTRLLFVIA